VEDLLARIEAHVRRHELIPPGGEVTCLVSGGADSTCLWHVLQELGYRVRALHVDHGLRGAESAADARFCRETLGAEVVELPPAGAGGRSLGRAAAASPPSLPAGITEAELRDLRYSVARDRLRATGHTASDQVETILYRLVSRGAPTGMAPRRDDGVVHPLLTLWREETEEYCRERGLAFRLDSSNTATKRGLIRERILPLLRELHPAADENLLRALDTRPTLSPALAELLAAPAGSRRVDLGGGVQAVREHDRLWLERGPVDLDGTVIWGPWRITASSPGLKVRGWRPGDRLAGRTKKIQDVFVDAKIPRSDREGWPLVVRGDEVVAVPGIVEHPEVECARRLDGARDTEEHA
jgi:tRNA(Ile)-lysidine synthase